MSTQYNILTNDLTLNRFYGGEIEGVKLQITGPYIDYYTDNYTKYNYKEVLKLKNDLIEFLRNNKNIKNSRYSLNETLILNKKQVKTLVTDLHLYLNDEIFKR